MPILQAAGAGLVAVMALVPAYSPVIGSVLISLSLLFQGLAMRRLAREA